MSNFRKVNNDILREWLNYIEETELGYLTKEDRKHTINFDEISEKILNSIPKHNRNFVKKQLDLLDSNFTDYIIYLYEKYYRNGFCDSIELINGCFE